MTVVIPSDGAKKRFNASKENELARKQQMVAKGKDLRKKIDMGEVIKALKEHPGWKLIEVWYTGKWSYDRIMDARRTNREKCDEMMLQREALTLMEQRINQWIKEGDQARAELNEQERENA